MSPDRLLRDIIAGLAPGRDAVQLVASGEVLVDGLPATSPLSRVRAASSVTLRADRALRGAAKLRAAFEAFGVEAQDRVALDVGAAAGGFTTVLLEAGARRVYAVDVGHGQLLGSLRQDSRVVDLEATNVAALDTSLVPEPVELIVVDVSYLSLGAAVAQLVNIELAGTAVLVGLVKPMFELRAATAPSDDASLSQALAAASAAVGIAGWRVLDSIHSPVTGSRGSREMLLHAVHA